MAQWILKANAEVIPRCLSRPLKVDELQSESQKQKCEIFNGFTERKWYTSINPPTISGIENANEDFLSMRMTIK